jgi:hypothetical protein
MKSNKEKHCRNCKHINLKERSDIGGLLIAKCLHPEGTTIGDTPINGDYVEMNATCAKHETQT